MVIPSWRNPILGWYIHSGKIFPHETWQPGCTCNESRRAAKWDSQVLVLSQHRGSRVTETRKIHEGKKNQAKVSQKEAHKRCSIQNHSNWFNWCIFGVSVSELLGQWMLDPQVSVAATSWDTLNINTIYKNSFPNARSSLHDVKPQRRRSHQYQTPQATVSTVGMVSSSMDATLRVPRYFVQ